MHESAHRGPHRGQRSWLFCHPDNKEGALGHRREPALGLTRIGVGRSQGFRCETSRWSRCCPKPMSGMGLVMRIDASLTTTAARLLLAASLTLALPQVAVEIGRASCRERG